MVHLELAGERGQVQRRHLPGARRAVGSPASTPPDPAVRVRGTLVYLVDGTAPAPPRPADDGPSAPRTVPRSGTGTGRPLPGDAHPVAPAVWHLRAVLEGITLHPALQTVARQVLAEAERELARPDPDRAAMARRLGHLVGLLRRTRVLHRAGAPLVEALRGVADALGPAGRPVTARLAADRPRDW